MSTGMDTLRIRISLIWDIQERNSALFELGRDVLSGADILNKKQRITGSGKRFSLVARNDSANEEFNISKFLLYLVPGDEKVPSFQ